MLRLQLYNVGKIENREKVAQGNRIKNVPSSEESWKKRSRECLVTLKTLIANPQVDELHFFQNRRGAAHFGNAGRPPVPSSGAKV